MLLENGGTSQPPKGTSFNQNIGISIPSFTDQRTHKRCNLPCWRNPTTTTTSQVNSSYSAPEPAPKSLTGVKNATQQIEEAPEPLDEPLLTWRNRFVTQLRELRTVTGEVWFAKIKNGWQTVIIPTRQWRNSLNGSAKTTRGWCAQPCKDKRCHGANLWGGACDGWCRLLHARRGSLLLSCSRTAAARGERAATTMNYDHDQPY